MKYFTNSFTNILNARVKDGDGHFMYSQLILFDELFIMLLK